MRKWICGIEVLVPEVQGTYTGLAIPWASYSWAHTNRFSATLTDTTPFPTNTGSISPGSRAVPDSPHIIFPTNFPIG